MHHAIKTYGEVRIKLHTFLTSILDTGEWSALHPSHYFPKIQSNIIFPSIPRFSEWSLPFRFLGTIQIKVYSF